MSAQRSCAHTGEVPRKIDHQLAACLNLKKAPRLVQHLMSKVAPLYAERAGGYTRIIKLDKRRVGDQSDLVLLQLVGKEEGPQVSGRRSNRRRTADKRTAYAADLRKKGSAKAEAPAAE